MIVMRVIVADVIAGGMGVRGEPRGRDRVENDRGGDAFGIERDVDAAADQVEIERGDARPCQRVTDQRRFVGAVHARDVQANLRWPQKARCADQGLNCGKHFLGVAVDLDAVPALHDLAVGTDQICRARHAHVLLAVHGFLLPHAVLLHHRVIRIGEQRELESVLLREPRLALRVEHADAEHRRLALLELRQVVLEGARLLGAAGRVVLGIEVEHHRLAGVVGQRVGLARLVRQ